LEPGRLRWYQFYPLGFGGPLQAAPYPQGAVTTLGGYVVLESDADYVQLIFANDSATPYATKASVAWSAVAPVPQDGGIRLMQRAGLFSRRW
jgi:hypothetical protein